MYYLNSNHIFHILDQIKVLKVSLWIGETAKKIFLKVILICSLNKRCKNVKKVSRIFQLLKFCLSWRTQYKEKTTRPEIRELQRLIIG